MYIRLVLHEHTTEWHQMQKKAFEKCSFVDWINSDNSNKMFTWLYDKDKTYCDVY